MASEERSSWVMVVAAITAYATYLSLILGGGAAPPLVPADYGWQLFWTILGAIVATVLGSITKIALYRGGLPRW